jgi:peptide/nickel transport system ATP-binding protein
MLPSSTVLEVKELTVEFLTAVGVVRAVDNVSFSIARGEVLGLAGESGSGKSTIAHALLRVLHPSSVCRGQVSFGGMNVLEMNPAQLRRYRWEGVSLVMQGAMNSLNPVLTIQAQIADVIRTHKGGSRKDAKAAVPELLDLVGIDPARARSYPHEFSGGMRQRCVIAMALALEPDLVVMDEPTTALDVVVQHSIMDELDRLRERLGFSVLLISHDLDLVAERASRVAIMYAGALVEIGPAQQVALAPSHPYTRALLASAMSVDGPVRQVEALPGRVPDLIGDRTGCAFYPRCSSAQPYHEVVTPALQEVTPGHQVACHLYTPAGASRE